MKTSAIVTASLATSALANGPGNGGGWWGGAAPDCAQSCLSSFYSDATASQWPKPSDYCTASESAPIATCISTACSATPTAFSSYKSLSTSLCSRWSSCSSAGSTGVYTLTAPTSFSGPGPNRFGGGGGGPGGGAGWANWNSLVSKSWTGGEFTVTGCTWDGPNPWGGGPGGWGGPGNAWGGWGDWGHGWTWSTQTTTLTTTAVVAGATATTTVSGAATLAIAKSGDATNVYVIDSAQAAVTNPSSANAAAPTAGGEGALLGVKVIGAVLAGGVAAVGLL